MEPYANVTCSLGKWTAEDGDKFVSVETNLDDVVDPCKEWSKRESSNKDSNKSILNNYKIIIINK